MVMAKIDNCIIGEVLNYQNLFTEPDLANWFSNYVQFCSGCRFSEPAELLGSVKKMNHLNLQGYFP